MSFGALIPKPSQSKFVMKKEEEVMKYVANKYHEVRRARRCGKTYEVELHAIETKGTLAKWGNSNNSNNPNNPSNSDHSNHPNL